jgi:hypothetical protein
MLTGQDYYKGIAFIEYVYDAVSVTDDELVEFMDSSPFQSVQALTTRLKESITDQQRA